MARRARRTRHPPRRDRRRGTRRIRFHIPFSHPRVLRGPWNFHDEAGGVTIRFPDGFLWGAATSAYQIEGSSLADGAGPSIWHRFSHSAGRTANGETGDIACDHYRRYADDVALMRELGLNSY